MAKQLQQEHGTPVYHMRNLGSLAISCNSSKQQNVVWGLVGIQESQLRLVIATLQHCLDNLSKPDHIA